ncbi:hypothetical protein FT637_25110 [Bacillus cereus]|uniref:hypothetical protein n=1 Tax=Bacillus cereus TaxID=1396 RepID=UPI00187A1388|nr:hypothetical protein [Bacillus cereus]MBE7106167.1 hypothetical protein [Bacillus cereus]
MSKIIDIFKRLLSGINTQYLVKSYIISIVVTGFFLYMNFTDGHSSSFMTTVYFLLAGLLFPFATVVWDDLINTIMGGHFIILALPFMLMWKLFKIMVLYMFSPLIAPIGMIYIYIANGYHKG